MTIPNKSPEQLSELPFAKELSARYKLIRKIGAGRCSVVYLAMDQFEQRQVVIKVARLVNTKSVDKTGYKLWLNEVRSAGQLKHQFIVDTYEAGLVTGGGYIVMEYLPGGTLNQFTQPEKLLPIERVIEIIFKVCKALEYVNSIGILHRNIKPGNILLNQNGDIKISDFGSCYEVSVDATQESDIEAICFMPPEQFKNALPNIQFDIYATGLMAYQLITGHSLYDAKTHDSLVYHKLNVEPPSPSKWRQDISARLSEVVLRAIAQEPEQRYKDWKEFSNDLVGTIPASGTAKEISNDSAKYTSLSKLDFFREFDQKELWETVQISTWIRYQQGEPIFWEGDDGTSIYVIIIGEAEVLKGDLKINHMKQGSCFGELAYIDKTRHSRTASVVASTTLVALCIDGERLRQSSDGLQVRFSGALLRAMLGKITQADRRYIAIAELR